MAKQSEDRTVKHYLMIYEKVNFPFYHKVTIWDNHSIITFMLGILGSEKKPLLISERNQI